jgi:glutamyl-tRNA synthetase
MTSCPVVRFAPSPTGRLHVGNARVALVNWLFAKSQGGTFILRHDDTDADRAIHDAIEAIEADLLWLGLEWDQRIQQSDRQDAYDTAIATLKKSGRLYPCFETAEELSLKRKVQLAAGNPPIYDRAAQSLTPAGRKAFEADGRNPHWRFQMEPGRVGWPDLVHGDLDLDAGALSDPVLIREDGTPLYTLTSVVDDIEFGVSHVIRGEDHIANTVPQSQLFQALGGKAPGFAHLALLTGPNGKSLSKRLGSASVESFREQGFEAVTLTSLLARLGTSDPVEPRADLGEVVAGFDIARFGRSPTKFDSAELEILNPKVLHRIPFTAVTDRLQAAVGELATEAFWEMVRPNLNVFSDVSGWASVVTGPITPVIEDAEFASKAAVLLPLDPWSDETWPTWTGAIKAATGAKGRDLFHPLRLALTGQEKGPEMKKLLPLIGRDRVAARLAGKMA